MSNTTLSTLISKANANDIADIDAAWTLKQIAKALPADAPVLQAPSEVIAEVVPEFRRKAGGLIRIGDHVVGQAAHIAFLDGRKGKWTEMKEDIFATLRDGAAAPVPAPAIKKAAAPAKPKADKAPTAKVVADENEDYLVCEECGKRVSYEEGLVRVGGKRICGKCAHKRHAHVAA